MKVTSMALWVVGAVFAGVVGLRYVSLTNQIHATGRQINELEVEAKEIDGQMRSAAKKVSDFTSHKELNRKLNEGFIKMVKITDDRVVHITTKNIAGAPEDVRVVANQGARR